MQACPFMPEYQGRYYLLYCHNGEFHSIQDLSQWEPVDLGCCGLTREYCPEDSAASPAKVEDAPSGTAWDPLPANAPLPIGIPASNVKNAVGTEVETVKTKIGEREVPLKLFRLDYTWEPTGQRPRRYSVSVGMEVALKDLANVPEATDAGPGPYLKPCPSKGLRYVTWGGMRYLCVFRET